MKKLLKYTTSALIVGTVLIGHQSLQANEVSRNFRSSWSSGLGSFSFALIGDLPYREEGIEPFQTVIESINQEPGVRFVMHAGDIKSGGELCSDELLQSRFNEFQKFKTAFIFTPGDNEWTDCHRTNNGSYNPLERLEFLRKLFFPNPAQTTGQKPIAVASQSLEQLQFSKYVENVLFVRNRIVFSTIHVVGSNNSLLPWTGETEPTTEQLAEFEERQQAVLAWLDYTFAKAADTQAAGVFLMMQANPNFELPEGDPNRAGFDAILAKMATLARQFGKPVVIAHGDNHVYLVDKPYYNYSVSGSERISGLTRVQTFGDFGQQWIKVNVNPNSSPVFSFEEKIVNP